MPKDVDDYVADNRRQIREVDSRFIQVDSRQNRDLSFGTSTVSVGVEVAVYTRPTGSQVVAGHADPLKGFGRGTFGDDKGEWTLQTDVEATATFTKQGRKALAEALNGKNGAATRGVAGAGTTSAATSDKSLVTPIADAGAWSTKENSSESTRVHTVYDAADWVGSSAGEFGIEDEDGRLLARVTIDPANTSIGDTDEVKGEVVLTFTGSGQGKSVITNEGEVALADAIAYPKSTVGPKEFAFGSGNTDFSKTDTALTTEEFRKDAAREPARDRVTAKTHVYKSEPSGTNAQPVDLTEVGLFDNNNRMLWATTFRKFTKDSSIAFNAETTIAVN